MSESETNEAWRRPRGLGSQLLRAAAWLSPTVAKYTHGSLALVRDPGGSALLVKHHLRERGAWSFPGGTHGPHEDPKAAVIREVYEETKLDVDVDSLRLLTSYTQPWANHYDHLFVVDVGFGESYAVRGLEIKDADFFDLSDPSRLKLTVATRYALYRLKLLEGQDG